MALATKDAFEKRLSPSPAAALSCRTKVPPARICSMSLSSNRWKSSPRSSLRKMSRAPARSSRSSSAASRGPLSPPSLSRSQQPASLLPPSSAFFGTLTGEALAAAYASSDIFLFPSTTEGWGGTCLEAQAAGLPVVATRSSGIVEVIADAIGGYLLPPGDTRALADAVARLATDDAERRAMGRRAAGHAARFDWAASGDTMLCEYGKHALAVPPREEELRDRAVHSAETPAQPQPTPDACPQAIEIVDVPAPIRRKPTVAQA